MPEWLTIVLVIAVVLILIGAIWWAGTKGRDKKIQQQRETATKHREDARAAAHSAGEAELAARRQEEEADRARDRAAELEHEADKVDPDRDDR